MTTDPNLLTSIRRTLVPIAVGFLIAQAARVGFDLPAEEVTGLVESIVTAAYYVAVRVVEAKFPQAGLLLGAVKQPHYE